MNLLDIRRRDPVEMFAQQATSDMTDAARRELEMKILKPAPLPKTAAPLSHAETKLTMYVKVYFDTMEELEQFSSLVRVGKMTERTTRDSKKIINALQAAQ